MRSGLPDITHSLKESTTMFQNAMNVLRNIFGQNTPNVTPFTTLRELELQQKGVAYIAILTLVWIALVLSSKLG
jgi:hypothetical protein